jgi:hypothetical protein
MKASGEASLRPCEEDAIPVVGWRMRQHRLAPVCQDATRPVVAESKRTTGVDGSVLDTKWRSGSRAIGMSSAKQPSDVSNEWIVEMAIPLTALGLKGEPGERIGLALQRCGTSRAGVRSCGTWGDGKRRGVLVLDP